MLNYDNAALKVEPKASIGTLAVTIVSYSQRSVPPVQLWRRPAPVSVSVLGGPRALSPPEPPRRVAASAAGTHAPLAPFASRT